MRTTTAGKDSWTAWRRTNKWQPWRPLAEGVTEGEAHAATFRQRQGGDYVVLPSDQNLKVRI
jgi:hypothetical protein